MTDTRYGSIGSELSAVQVWVCSNEDLPMEFAETLASHWLDEGERHTAGRFIFDRDREQYLVAHTFVRRILGLELGIPEAELSIGRTEKGRPFLDGADTLARRSRVRPDFNLSHTRGVNVVAVGHGRRVGIDVERVDRTSRSRLDLFSGVFSEREQRWLGALPEERRPYALLRLWTLKEAYTKARGLGMSLPFDSFDFTLSAERGVLEFRPPPCDESGLWRFVELQPSPRSLVALAIDVSGGLPARKIEIRHGFPWKQPEPVLVTLPQSLVVAEEHY
ncbi:4'-phosphopantetheinyl transferase superfamily protein [Streptomyces sp. NPDC048442]|uniref:4'-phosphopantetheinyl transferase family protein n=1 Tax=Streptomyces sp. NPDC048442 TaxID=3154823 RepID=UPI00343F493B